jgi:transaldolase
VKLNLAAGALITPGALEKLIACSPEAEIWWDSSPLIYALWMEETLAESPNGKRRLWRSQLERLFNPVSPCASLVRGATTNPILSGDVLFRQPEIWIPRIRRWHKELGTDDAEMLFRKVYREIIRSGAALLEPVFKATRGRFGWVSAQVDPRRAFDAAAMIEEGKALASIAPNVMIKIPGTLEGYQVIEALAALAISTNNTITYSIAQLQAYAEAISRGLEKAYRDKIPTGNWRAVFTYMTGRCGQQGTLAREARDRGLSLTETDLRWAEVAIAKHMHKMIQRARWPVKLLLSSMRASTVDENSASLHLEETAGGAIVYTCPPLFIREVMGREERMLPLEATAIRRSVPADRWRRFADLPYFRHCNEPDGLAVSEFNQLAPLRATLSDFIEGLERTQSFIARAVA